jgi:hypothetical protein
MEISKMPSNAPVTASGTRELKRPRPIPRTVRDVIALMVFGAVDDPDSKPVAWIDAAKTVGIKPDVMRRYFDRADVRALLRSERRAFREMVCSGNEGALQRIRDKSSNGMAVVASVRALEQIEAEAEQRPAGNQTPGVTIVIRAAPSAPIEQAPRPLTIEARPVAIEKAHDDAD